jgi:hypothetical protein
VCRHLRPPSDPDVRPPLPTFDQSAPYRILHEIPCRGVERFACALQTAVVEPPLPQSVGQACAPGPRGSRRLEGGHPPDEIGCHDDSVQVVGHEAVRTNGTAGQAQVAVEPVNDDRGERLVPKAGNCSRSTEGHEKGFAVPVGVMRQSDCPSMRRLAVAVHQRLPSRLHVESLRHERWSRSMAHGRSKQRRRWRAPAGSAVTSLRPAPRRYGTGQRLAATERASDSPPRKGRQASPPDWNGSLVRGWRVGGTPACRRRGS